MKNPLNVFGHVVVVVIAVTKDTLYAKLHIKHLTGWRSQIIWRWQWQQQQRQRQQQSIVHTHTHLTLNSSKLSKLSRKLIMYAVHCTQLPAILINFDFRYRVWWLPRLTLDQLLRLLCVWKIFSWFPKWLSHVQNAMSNRIKAKSGQFRIKMPQYSACHRVDLVRQIEQSIFKLQITRPPRDQPSSSIGDHYLHFSAATQFYLFSKRKIHKIEKFTVVLNWVTLSLPVYFFVCWLTPMLTMLLFRLWGHFIIAMLIGSIHYTQMVNCKGKKLQVSINYEIT